jgi:hypothetical protein
MELEIIMLSEVSQIEKDKLPCFLSYVKDQSKNKYKHYHTYIYTQNMFPTEELS